MLTALAVSFLVTPNRGASLPYVILSAAGCGAALLATSLPRHRRPGARAGFIVLLAATLLLLVWALLTARWPTDKLSILSGVYATLPTLRSTSVTWLAEGLQPNQLGGALATFVGFSIAIALGRRGARAPTWLRTAAGCLAFLGGLVVLLTGSRAALAGIIVAGMVLLVLRDKRWSILPAGVAAGLVTAQATESPGVIRLLLDDHTVGTNLVSRIDIWTSSVHGIEDHALTGIGLGVFNQVVPLRYPYETVGINHAVSQAHNVFLDVGLSLGLLGITAFILLLVSQFAMVVVSFRHDLPTKSLFLATASSLVVFLVFGITDSLGLSSPSGSVFWVWCIVFALYYRQEFDETAVDGGNRCPRTKAIP
jgi:O-antigen ligase